jgi:acetone carboxylase gamma subunit
MAPFPFWEEWKELRNKSTRGQRLGEYLEVSEISGRKLITCRKCNHVFCQADGNPKESAVMYKIPLVELPYLVPQWKANASLETMGRQAVLEFVCPGCATVFAVDVVVEGDPIMPDVLLGA